MIEELLVIAGLSFAGGFLGAGLLVILEYLGFRCINYTENTSSPSLTFIYKLTAADKARLGVSESSPLSGDEPAALIFTLNPQRTAIRTHNLLTYEDLLKHFHDNP